nr:GTP-binding protein [Mesorhizobium australicum]
MWGDRRQELVFIGVEPMDKPELTARLEACLVEQRVAGPAGPVPGVVAQRYG